MMRLAASSHPIGLRVRALRCALAAGVVATMAVHFSAPAGAQTKAPTSAVPQPTAAPETEGPAWKDLTRAQQNALRPLERDWSRIDGPRKRKWLEIAARFPSLSPEDRTRMQARMTEWARLSPQERNAARLNYRNSKDLSPQERRDRWETYQNLSEDERKELADKAARQRARNAKANEKGSTTASRSDTPKPQAKSNIVPNPAYATPPKPVAPTTLQARPGATTTPITKRPTPPWHQQPGMPKIAASPQFVDSNTLLPVVGPQGAGTVVPQKSGERQGQ